MEFIEAPAFSRYLSDYLGDDEYRALQKQLGGAGPGRLDSRDGRIPKNTLGGQEAG